jgi:hypothetical protein
MSSGPYITLEKLGEGTYATVHKVNLALMNRETRWQQARGWASRLADRSADIAAKQYTDWVSFTGPLAHHQ